MKLVGFGCSFTFGSELQSPNLDPNDFWANTRYREEHVWLGVLAERFGCEFDNLAEPANSNFAIGQQVTEYLSNNQDNITVCVAWTVPTRMSWYDDRWTHNGFVTDQTGWTASCREWITKHTDKSLKMYTENAKLIVNSVCKYYNVPLIQFNALGSHTNKPYTNYLANGGTMDGWLKQCQDERNKTYFANGGHPNEDGHRAWVDDVLGEWITAKKLL
jgi:hypothetical protein